MSRTIDVPLAQAAERIERDEKSRISAVFQGVREAAAVGAKVVSDHAPKDIGKLAASSHIESDVVGQVIHIMVDAPYAADVELGTLPHVVPLRVLVDWVHRHMGSSSAIGAGSSDESAAFAIAHAIQSKIAMDGTSPTFFVRDSMPELAELVHSFVALRLAGW